MELVFHSGSTNKHHLGFTTLYHIVSPGIGGSAGSLLMNLPPWFGTQNSPRVINSFPGWIHHHHGDEGSLPETAD